MIKICGRPHRLLFAVAIAAFLVSNAQGANEDHVDVFAHFLRFKTVSSEDTENHVLHPEEFKAGHRFLKKSFPLVHSQLKYEEVANFSLLYQWEGSNKDLLPLALLAHQDVVPADTSPDSPWTKPPFGGVIEDGFVYGRGAIDTKFSLVAILTAAEQLLADGFKPERSLIFAFGHDEEVGGEHGAQNLAATLKDRGIEVEFVVDEGGMIATDGMPPITDQPLALVGTAEKGFETVQVALHAPGGHSSRPPIDKSSVLEIMGRVVTSVSDNPPPLRIVDPVPGLLKALAPAASSSFVSYLFKHSTDRLVGPVLTRLLASWSPVTAALVRTTVAPTLANAGLQDNVLPEQGTITFNFRTLPGEAKYFPEDYLWANIGADKSRADVRSNSGKEWGGTSVTPASGPNWDVIKQAISNTFTQYKGLIVAPHLLSGATDSRYYGNISKGGLYRFSGISLSAAEGVRIHGIDERVKVEGFLDGVKFFKRLMSLAAGGQSRIDRIFIGS